MTATTASITIYPAAPTPAMAHEPVRLHVGHINLEREPVIDLVERALRRMPYKSDGLFIAVLIEEIAREYGTGSVRLDLYTNLNPAPDPKFTLILSRNREGGMECQADEGMYTYHRTLPA